METGHCTCETYETVPQLLEGARWETVHCTPTVGRGGMYGKLGKVPSTVGKGEYMGNWAQYPQRWEEGSTVYGILCTVPTTVGRGGVYGKLGTVPSTVGRGENMGNGARSVPVN